MIVQYPVENKKRKNNNYNSTLKKQSKINNLYNKKNHKHNIPNQEWRDLYPLILTKNIDRIFICITHNIKNI